MTGEELDEIVDRVLTLPPGPRREELLAQLDDTQRVRVSALVGASDLVWSSAHGAPALEDDPVAAMLGLVPDPHFQLDYVALARICKANHVKPTALAERLVARGWELKVADVFRWQTRSSPDVSPALIRAIAQEIRCGPEQLTLQAASQPTPAVDAVDTPRFLALVQRFANVRRIPLGMARTALQSRMLATVHRGDEPDTEQMLESLEALVRALETDKER